MFRAFAAALRTSYLLAVMITLALLIPATVQFIIAQTQPRLFAPDLLTDLLLPALALLVFGGPALRALARLLLHRELVPDSHVRERPLIALLVGLACAIGTTLVLLVAGALITTLPESRDVNLAAPCALAAMLYAFGLLSGEIVLVGRYPSTA